MERSHLPARARPERSATHLRAWLVTAIAGGIALGLTACAATTPRVGRFELTDRVAINNVLDKQIEAWNRGDLPSYMDGYARTPTLIFTSGGDVRRGWQEALDHYQARYAIDPKAMGTLKFEVEQIDPVGADGAVVLGRWELTGTARSGRGVFSLVLERRPEGWRIVHDHTSLSP
jgi:ketosteroid isomerase-like protein